MMIARDETASPIAGFTPSSGQACGMLGQATSRLRRPGPAWLQARFGVLDLHARQKWNVIWPKLATLPPSGLSVIDAGCGDGIWSFELAARRPQWRILGIDLDSGKIGQAQSARERLGVTNAAFAAADFLHFRPAAPADLVLSVASAHYLGEMGCGPELFTRFAGWLRPGGRLILYGPRHLPELPVVGWLPKLSGSWGFTSRHLKEWSEAAGLDVVSLQPAVGSAGTLAKQIAILAGGAAPLRAAAYPLTLVLDRIDRSAGSAAPHRRSAAWCLVASRRDTGAHA